VTEQSTVPAGINPTVPSVARAYDYLLFGKDNYEVDRAMIHQMLQATPDMVWVARENRAYLGRVVRYLAETCGIRQFIDHGSGLPTQDNTHQVAQRYQPGARVVYTDNDPIVLAHGRALLAEDASTTVIIADMARPEDVLDNEDVRRLIDFTQPVGLLYVSTLHCLKDSEDPYGVVKRMLAAVPSGSYLAISHLVSDDDHAAAEVTRMANAAMRWGRVRRPEEVHGFFDGLEVVEPGLGNCAQWRLDLGPTLFPRPELTEEDADPWGPQWRDDAINDLPTRLLWEEGGVARKP
jgi:S-adenosyl methyltransferase